MHSNFTITFAEADIIHLLHSGQVFDPSARQLQCLTLNFQIDRLVSENPDDQSGFPYP